MSAPFRGATVIAQIPRRGQAGWVVAAYWERVAVPEFVVFTTDDMTVREWTSGTYCTPADSSIHALADARERAIQRAFALAGWKVEPTK